MIDMLNEIKETICRRQLIAPGDRVLVALSGGADSVALLDILLQLAEDMNFTVFAAHLHHGLRGAEADRDEAFVRNLCQKRNVPLFVRHADIAVLAKEAGVGLEEMGRRARYAFFEELLSSERLNKIATAHHAGDNIETVLMRLIRGTGPLGLGGIPYQNGAVVRPLLHVTRAQLETFLKERGISWCTDSTNEKTVFTRNRIRHQLVPMLERDFNPNFQKNFAEQIELYAACGAYLEEVTGQMVKQLARETSGGYVFSAKALLQESAFLVSMMLHKLINSLSSKRETGMEAVRSVEIILHRGRGRVHLGGNITAQMCHGSLYIHRDIKVKPFAYAIEPTGSFTIPETGQCICFSIVSAIPAHPEQGAAYINLNQLQGKKMMLRSRRDGDYFYPFGMVGKQKLKIFFINKKIPCFLRDAVPLLTADEDIVWVGGQRIDARYAAKTGDAPVLCVTIQGNGELEQNK